MTINQITSLVKAPNAVEKVRVFVIIAVVRPRKAQAPTGKGLNTRPAIVEIKIESNCQACGVTSRGLGTKNLIIRPTATEKNKGMSFAPWGLESVAGIGIGVEDDEMG